jgi:hypothetical protein
VSDLNITVLNPQLQSGTGIVERFVSILEEDDILHEADADLLLLLFLRIAFPPAPPPIIFNLNLG